MTSESSFAGFSLCVRAMPISNIDTCAVCEERRRRRRFLLFASFFLFYSVVVPTFQPLVGSIQLRPPLQTDMERVGPSDLR